LLFCRFTSRLSHLETVLMKKILIVTFYKKQKMKDFTVDICIYSYSRHWTKLSNILNKLTLQKIEI
jgi:hypothetical protein